MLISFMLSDPIYIFRGKNATAWGVRFESEEGNKGCCECDFLWIAVVVLKEVRKRNFLPLIFNKIVNRTFMDSITELLLFISL